MADGFEPYHVPQQSRRDKLRVVVQTDPSGCAGLLPLYDPSLFPSDLLSCANLHHHQNNHNPLLDEPTKPNPTHNSTVKREGVNLMGYVGSSSSTSQQQQQQQQHIYMDPQSSLHMNPSSIHDISNNPFLFTPQNLRVYDQSFNGDEVVVYKPEPLSLSLSSRQTHQSTLPLELNLQRYESSIFTDKVSGGVYVVPSIVGGGSGGGSAANDLSRSSVPLGPFTGYGSILKGSRFLKPAQQLLEEICDVGLGIYAEKITEDSGLMDAPVENLGGSGVVEESVSGEQRKKKSRLISMLNEIYRRYKYYYQQMQAVVASFESVAGLSNAAPYANLALKAMSKHFRSLKNAITDQLQFTNKDQNDPKDETPRLGIPDALYSQRPVHNLGFLENQPVWRPQRGLPERAVNVLRAWLFEHFLHPYPTDTDKIMLAKQTGLSRSQVSNWFINARVRLWKPMVEEIHMLETRQTQKSMQRDDQNADRPSDPSDLLPPGTSLASENPSTSTKRTRNDFPNTSMGAEEPMSLSYENLSRHHGSGGVSLTLGLHQNNGIGLSEPTFPLNAARRFGLDPNSEGYVMGGSFEAQNRQFGRDVLGGQFLHDFVG